MAPCLGVIGAGTASIPDYRPRLIPRLPNRRPTAQTDESSVGAARVRGVILGREFLTIWSEDTPG